MSFRHNSRLMHHMRLTIFFDCASVLLGQTKGIKWMDFIQSQKNMVESYVGGATGALASGLIWCIAGVVGIYLQPMHSMITLFIGGMLIFPLSMLLSKLFGHSGKHASDNVLGKLAVESLGILFAGLFIAFVVAQFNSALFYPIMLLAIGARYLVFQTLYGLRVYWVLGGLLMLSGFLSAALSLPFIAGAFIGGGIEIVFSILIYYLSNTIK